MGGQKCSGIRRSYVRLFQIFLLALLVSRSGLSVTSVPHSYISFSNKGPVIHLSLDCCRKRVTLA
ncbi:hypothetical protein EAP12_01080 [Salmonella enterica]|nr:hypothetical protein [Salmonella enterica]